MGKLGRKILVVDDEKLVRWSLCAHLSSLGYWAMPAESCREALEILEREKPVPLVITDLAMPDHDGVELISRARALYPGVRFLVITGCTEPTVIDRALAAGAAEALPKPFDLGEIGSVVGRYV